MIKYLSYLKLGFASVTGVIIGCLGGLDILLQVIIAMIIIDYITGVLVAIYDKKLSSEIGFKGIAKKVMILLLICMSYYLTLVIKTDIPIREMVIMFFIVNEAISITENAANMGLPIPSKLITILEQARGE